jgi:acyl dehydratase
VKSRTKESVDRMSEFRDLIGNELGPTEWLEVDQERIDGFAQATDDPQWIHTDPVRAAEGPFGTTIAHGFLTLSLCVPLMTEALGLTGYRMGINYGVNRVRFPAAVPSGSRVRARFTVQSVEEVAGGEQGVVLANVEREGGDKPVCVAELVVRMLR